VEGALGSVAARALGEDVAVLSARITTHAALATLHLVAALWDTPERVRAAAGRDLAELSRREVDCASALVALQAAPELALAEVVRAAAELEMPLLARLPKPPLGDVEARLGSLLDAVSVVAPALERIELAPPLARRGRVLPSSSGDRVLVGAPGIAGAEAEHVAWQAAHEATVVEVFARAAGPVNHEDVERRAIGLLRSRARRRDLAERHARWLATLDVGALGPIPDVDDGSERAP